MNELEQYVNILKLVKGDYALNAILMPKGGDSIVAFLANAAQWTNVLRVWDELASRCKKSQISATKVETDILVTCMKLFNLTLKDLHTDPQLVKKGAAYDYRIHQRTGLSGDTVMEVALFGITNAAGDVVRSAVVITR